MTAICPSPTEAAFCIARSSGDELDVHRVANDVLLYGTGADPYYRKQVEAILKANSADIDPSFLGFVGPYYLLAPLIPKDRVIYDMGSAYAIQGWFFRSHKRYVAVDVLTPPEQMLQMPNGEYHQTSIAEFLDGHEIQKPHFAFCNYVPPWDGGSESLVRAAFDHLFVFYPHCEQDPFDEMFSKPQQPTPTQQPEGEA